MFIVLKKNMLNELIVYFFIFLLIHTIDKFVKRNLHKVQIHLLPKIYLLVDPQEQNLGVATSCAQKKKKNENENTKLEMK